MNETVENLAGGLRAGLGYLGAEDLTSLREQARFVQVTAAGQKESSPHDVIEVKRSDFART